MSSQAAGMQLFKQAEHNDVELSKSLQLRGRI